MGVVQAHFRPEFINRLDDIVVFHPLDKRRSSEIARIQTEYLEKRLAERQLRIEISDKARSTAGQRRLRSGLRCPSAQACDPAAAGEPAGAAILAGEFGSGDTVRGTVSMPRTGRTPRVRD
jgi:ATP-dependent Clp protease ATP-binding subunit ClpB